MNTYPERMRTSSTAGFVSVWVAEYPTEEAARVELDRRIAESYPTGTASAWEWAVGQHRESHLPEQLKPWQWWATIRRGRRPESKPLPPPLTLYPFAVLRRITSPPNGPPAPASLREVAGVT